MCLTRSEVFVYFGNTSLENIELNSFSNAKYNTCNEVMEASISDFQVLKIFDLTKRERG